jgi:hypothetical protein
MIVLKAELDAYLEGLPEVAIDEASRLARKQKLLNRYTVKAG